jgi:hypothetical protein
MTTKKEKVAAILSKLDVGALDVLYEWAESGDLAEFSAAAQQERERRERLSGKAFIRARITATVLYDLHEGQKEPARILIRGDKRDPVQVLKDGGDPAKDEDWVTVEDGLTLPEGFEGRGAGWWTSFALSPTSADYSPINWVRWNGLLRLLGARYGPDLSPGGYNQLPSRRLRSKSRGPILQSYLFAPEHSQGSAHGTENGEDGPEE